MKDTFVFVRDIMVPLSDYATVSENSTLLTAIKSLENENKKFGDQPYRHQSVVVLNKKGRATGKVSQVDIMMALEPEYRKMGTDVDLGRFGFNSSFLKSIQDQYSLWERPLGELYKILENTIVKDIMYTPIDRQHLDESDTLEDAMHYIVVGRHHSLLVLKDGKVSGILRSTDVFNTFYNLLIED